MKGVKKIWLAGSVILIVIVAFGAFWIVKAKTVPQVIASPPARTQSFGFAPIAGVSPQEAPQVARECQAGRIEACQRLQALTMGYSNYAKLHQQQTEAMLTELCRNKKQDACEALSKLKKRASN